MIIEKLWNDVDIFYVVFESVNNLNTSIKTINKLIVLPSGTSTKHVENIVKGNFARVKKIRHIDLWDSALLLKNSKSMKGGVKDEKIN